jgi:hypothetical protein
VSAIIDGECRNRERVQALDAQVAGLIAQLEAQIAQLRA